MRIKNHILQCRKTCALTGNKISWDHLWVLQCPPLMTAFFQVTGCHTQDRRAMGTNWGTGSSVWTWGRTSSLWGWWSTGTGCPEGLWSLFPWRYSKPAWTTSSAACCRWPCFGRGVGLDDPQRSLTTLNILWFCDSVNQLHKYRMVMTN